MVSSRSASNLSGAIKASARRSRSRALGSAAATAGTASARSSREVWVFIGVVLVWNEQPSGRLQRLDRAQPRGAHCGVQAAADRSEERTGEGDQRVAIHHH